MLKVSVLVCVYNGGQTIRACIESLLNQDFDPKQYEIVVVENGSTDDTTAIIEEYPVKLFHNTVRGLARARNFGIGKAEGEIIAMIDADCIADPQWLSELVKFYDDPEIGGVGGEIKDFVHEKRTPEEVFAAQSQPLKQFHGGDNEYLPRLAGANFSFRRSVLVELNGFNPQVPTGEDVDMSWRVQIDGKKKLAYAPKAIVFHHHRSTRTGLARQFRQYGFGEIMLDTMYGKQPGYPRTLGFQIRRISGQIMALGRYVVSMVIRRIRWWRGKATAYDLLVPELSFLIESNNILGKFEALVKSRLMTSPASILKDDPDAYVDRFFQSRKE